MNFYFLNFNYFLLFFITNRKLLKMGEPLKGNNSHSFQPRGNFHSPVCLGHYGDYNGSNDSPVCLGHCGDYNGSNDSPVCLGHYGDHNGSNDSPVCLGHYGDHNGSSDSPVCLGHYGDYNGSNHFFCIILTCTLSNSEFQLKTFQNIIRHSE